MLGIAGPGDPLAIRERTFATFRMLAEQAPDIKLCVSTNGLALPDCVDELAKHNIEHVTITINCIDPARRGRKSTPGSTGKTNAFVAGRGRRSSSNASSRVWRCWSNATSL